MKNIKEIQDKYLDNVEFVLTIIYEIILVIVAWIATILFLPVVLVFLIKRKIKNGR